MLIELTSSEDFSKLKENSPAFLAYFSTQACSVCHVLQPKVEELVSNYFPKLQMVSIQSDVYPHIAAENQVFTAPTILVFFEGREYIRKSRTVGILELQQEISRIYSVMFE